MASIPKEQVVKIRTELDNAVVVRPGDKLVVGVSTRLDMATAHEIKRRLGERLPGVEIVIIDQCSGLAIYRDDPSIIPLEEPLSTEKLDRIRAELAETLPGE